MTKFSKRLQELRKSKGLSQQALGLELKFSQAAIARWEAGTQIPNIEVAISFAKFFSVSTDYLLGLIDFE